MSADKLPAFDPEFASPRDWALMYRACGLQVVPGRYPMRDKNDKRPALANWVEFQEAIVAEGIFDSWFKASTPPSMGVITGRASDNVFVVDLDTHTNPKAAEWWSTVLLLENHGMEPETWGQVTGGGGRQLFFRAPAGWHAPTNRTPMGVDIRGQGGYAQLPPTRHYSGQEYAWAPGCAPWEVELLEAPQWLLNAVDALVEQHGGDQRNTAGAERTPSPATEYDAFGARVDGREDAMRSWVWRSLLELYLHSKGVLPEHGGEAQREASLNHWLRETKTRLRGVDNAEGLERECRGATAFREKWKKGLKKWDGAIAKHAADLAGKRAADRGPFDADPAPEPPPRPVDPEPAELLPLIPAFPFDATAIPPRDWLVPGLLLRRYLSVLVAPPGSGKSLLTLQQACAVVSGKEWGGWRVRGKTPTIVLNAEDDHDEMRRRLYGATQVMGLSQGDLDGLFLMQSPESVVITRTDPRTKAVVRLPLIDRLVATIEASGAGLIVVDPFAETFEGDENNNSEVKWAGIAWREIARRTGAAVWLVHHTRKYASGMAGDADASRGGGALIGTARIVSTLFGMTEEEATAMNVPVEDRTQYVRFDDAKANLSLVTANAKWFRKHTVPIPNGGTVPGDDVGALVPWKPPGLLEDVSVRSIGLLLDVLQRGLLDGDGEPTGALFTASSTSANKARWAGTKVAEMLGCDEPRAKKILSAWLSSGLLIEVEYRDKREGKDRKGIQVDQSKRPDRG